MTEFEFIKEVVKKYPLKIFVLLISDIFGGFLILVGIGGIVTVLAALFSGDAGNANLPAPLDKILGYLGLEETSSMQILLFLLGLYLLQLILDGLKKYFVAKISIGFRKDIRQKLNHVLLNIDWVSFTVLDQGKYINNLISESSTAGGAVRTLAKLFADGLITIIFLGWIALFSFPTFAVFIIISILSFFIAQPLFQRSRLATEEKIIVNNLIGNAINDTKNLFKILIVENLVSVRTAIVDHLIRKIAEAEEKNSLYSTITAQFLNLVPLLLIASLAFYYLSFEKNAGEKLIFDLLILQQIGKYFISFQSNRQSLINKIPSYEFCMEMAGKVSDVHEERKGTVKINSLHTGVVFEQVSYLHSGGYAGITNVECSLPAKGLVFILGRSGSGKTTLVDVLLKVYSPQKGRVLIDGSDLRQIEKESFSRIVAYLPQEVYLFQGSLRENLLLGSDERDDQKIFKALDAADCLDLVENLPQGLDTLISSGGSNFSGGERHRLALARALIRKAKILVLDEPSSSVDRHSEEAILKALKTLSQEILVIVISHSRDIIQGNTNLIAMKDGNCVWQGNYDQFIDTIIFDDIFTALNEK